MRKYRIIGKGGLFSIIREVMMNQAEYDGYYDDIQGNPLDGYLGKLTDLNSEDNVDYFIAIGGEHNMLLRAKILINLTHQNRIRMNCISPISYIFKNALLGSGNIILPFSHIGSQCRIGSGNIIFSHVNIEHDSVIGNNVNIAPGVKTGGGCTIGNNVFIGVGSTISDSVSIGNNTLIGAGSLVLKDIPENSLVYGSPAKVIGVNTKYREIY